MFSSIMPQNILFMREQSRTNPTFEVFLVNMRTDVVNESAFSRKSLVTYVTDESFDSTMVYFVPFHVVLVGKVFETNRTLVGLLSSVHS